MPSGSAGWPTQAMVGAWCETSECGGEVQVNCTRGWMVVKRVGEATTCHLPEIIKRDYGKKKFDARKIT